jgi:hypothetical protein
MVISFVVLSVKVSAGEAEADGRDLVQVGEYFLQEFGRQRRERDG